MSASIVSLAESRASPASTRASAFVYADSKIHELMSLIERVASTDAAVLITGETGTGKEVLARQIHAESGRAGPFLAINCGALPQSLAEAELFGHQAGAFTGASETRAGWFEAANGGTLFLDEIGELAPAMQVMLLRVLQEREVVRVGSRRPIPVNTRVIAATNVALGSAVASGAFRLDLYYRLNVVTLALPPLRERRGDIIPLAEHFARALAGRLSDAPPSLTGEAKEKFIGYDWPGNIRELENVMQVAILEARGEGAASIRPDHVRFVPAPTLAAKELPQARTPLEAIAAELDRLFLTPPQNLYRSLEEIFLKRAYDFCAGNQVNTARLLGVSRNILRTQLKNFGMIGGNEARRM